jgi:multiple sugar transport system permease protein
MTKPAKTAPKRKKKSSKRGTFEVSWFDQLWENPIVSRVVVIVGAITVIVNGVYPMLWMFLTSLKDEGELTTKPISYLPKVLITSNYQEIFKSGGESERLSLSVYFINSLVVSGVSTLLCVLIAALAAYALARLKLRYRGLISIIIVAASMFPAISLMIPLFQIMRNLNWLNQYQALILPYVAMSLPIATLILTTFFQSIPEDLESAAQVDGCSRLGALWRIIVPLAAPGVVTAAIIVFVNSWNEFLLASTLSASPSRQTLPVGIQNFQGEMSFPWPLISAAIIISIVPIVILIAAFQQRVVSGLTAGSVKG